MYFEEKNKSREKRREKKSNSQKIFILHFCTCHTLFVCDAYDT